MLLQFNVTNYMSYKNETILSSIANNDKEHKDYLISFHNINVLPVLAIYGANASGKTNINKALTFAIRFVRNSNRMQISDMINVLPFMLDDNSKNEKSRFDFIFVHEGIKYEYGFVCDQNYVYEEYLYEYKSSKASLIFERENINHYRYTNKYKKELSAIEGKNTDNKLFLSTATLWNATGTKNAYMWFEEGIDVYDSSVLESVFIDALQQDMNQEIKKFMKDLLKNADMNIVDYDFRIEAVKANELSLPSGIKLDEQLLLNLKSWELNTKHKIIIDGVEKNYEIPFEFESRGTKNLFYFGPIIKKSLSNGKTIVIDEIDSGLHPLLVRYLISLFHDKKHNSKGAQLFFNTHDTSILSLDLFRRDQIYFVEKNNDTGVSEVYSLDEYSPRTSENIRKGYFLGRFGAIPLIKVEDLW